MAKTLIAASPASARYASGHLLFVRGQALVAQPFDPGTLSLSGEAVPVAPSVKWSFWREGLFGASSTGRLLLEAGIASEDSQLVWVDRQGRELGSRGGPADYRRPSLSHDQLRLAASVTDPQTGNRQIRVLDLERGTSTRLTFEACQHWMPRWSPDDRTVYFTANRGGNGDVYAKASSGAGAVELVYQAKGWDGLSSVSSDGGTGWVLGFGGESSRYDVYRVDLESRKAEVALRTPSKELDPEVSPDGRWLLYDSDESGRFEVYVQSLGKDGGKWQISTEGGEFGKWTRGGREIVFQARDGKLMAVEVTLEPTFSAASPTVLFDPRARRIGFGRQYDVTPDGSRFIVNRPIEPAGAESLSLVENWTRLLER
jgi:dipeptidyl aminopeptidase/acylaminoacyl peptidase